MTPRRRTLPTKPHLSLTALGDNGEDRGAIVLHAAILDDALGYLLSRAFVSDEGEATMLLGADGPLGTFSARSQLAYLLGYISQSAYRDLGLIRKVRNDAAHARRDVGFDSPSVASRCSELALASLLESRDAKLVYWWTCVLLTMYINKTADGLDSGSRRPTCLDYDAWIRDGLGG